MTRENTTEETVETGKTHSNRFYHVIYTEVFVTNKCNCPGLTPQRSLKVRRDAFKGRCFPISFAMTSRLHEGNQDKSQPWVHSKNRLVTAQTEREVAWLISASWRPAG